MTVPLMVLAVLSAVGGLLNVPHIFGGHEWLKGWLAKAADAVGAEHLELSSSTEWTLMAVSTALVLLTIWYTWTLFGKKTTLDGDPAEMPFLKRLIARKWLLDELYAALFEKPFSWLSRNLFGIGEEKIAVPLTVGSGRTALGAGDLLRKLQTGNTSFYLFGMMVGVVVLLIITYIGA
jgi:NADH-quinone oxidoreductase subunit L